jgi:hypothetical protein
LRPEVAAVAAWIEDEAGQEATAPLHRLLAE